MKPEHQKIFDRVTQHLLNQRYPSVQDEIDESCLYRGPKGRSCSIGCLIDDEYYNEMLEGNTIYEEDIQVALRLSGINIDDLIIIEMLSQLQGLHDELVLNKDGSFSRTYLKSEFEGIYDRVEELEDAA